MDHLFMRIAAAAFFAVGVTLVAATPAFAHSDQGTMAAEVQPGAQPLTVTVRARVAFANDGHPAGEAAVNVTGTGPGGAPVGPTTLNRVDAGEYEATVTLPAPGDWSLQFNSTNPTATATATATLAATSTQAPPTSQVRRATANDDGDDDGSGLSAPAFVIGGAVVVAALVGGVLVVRRRR
jgi:hypothetical protein